MYAIIRKGNKQYYLSAIFAQYNDSVDKNYFDDYFIVFNEDKTELIKQPVFNPDKRPYLDLMVLKVDDDSKDWCIDKNGYGGVEFFSKELWMEYARGKKIPDDVMKKCRNLDGKYTYREINEIKTKEDIEKLMLVSGGFHDACIADKKQLEDGSLKVLFDGVWGCCIEMIFENNVSYCTESRESDYNNPYWFGASMFIDNETIIFVDSEDVELHDFDNSYCWFKAGRVTYRVIPK